MRKFSLLLVLLLCSLALLAQSIGGNAGIGGKAGLGGGSVYTRLGSCTMTGTGNCKLTTTGASAFTIEDVSGTTTVTAPTDSSSNTYVAEVGFTGANNAAEGYVVCAPTTSSSTTFTGGAASNIYFVQAWAGTATSSCYDTGSARTQAGGATTAYQPGSITPATTNELLVSAVINSDNGTGWSVPLTVLGGSWALLNTSSGFGADAAAFTVDPTTAPYNPSWNNTAKPNCGGVLMALKHP